MAVPDGPTEKRYSANGITTSFTIPFLLLAASDLKVYLNDLEVTSGFTVTGIGAPQSTITFTSAPSGILLLQLSVPFQRLNDYQENGDFLASTVNRDFDRIWQALKQLLRYSTRALSLGFFDVDGNGFYRAKGNGIVDMASANGVDTAAANWKDVKDLVATVLETGQGPINNAANIVYVGPDGVPHVVQDISGPGGAGLIGFDPAQIFPPNSVGSAIFYNRRKTVKSYGAVGDGVTDDTAAVKAAIAAAGPNGMVVFDEGGEYLIKETLVQPTSQQWIGQGGQRSARLKKGFNGDLVVMGGLGAVSDLTLNNNGMNFTGRGLYVSSGFSQTIFRVRSVQSKGPSLEFAQDAGGGCNVVAFEGDTVDPLTVGAVKIAGDTGPHPRLFNGFWLSGGFLDLAGPGAGNGCSFSNFYIRNIKTIGPAVGGTALCHFVNGRVASINDTTVLSGSDITMASVAFSGAVILDNMQGFKAEACTFGAGITETATSRFNSYSDQVKTFSPTWSQSTGPQPSIGNGSLTGKYTRQGYLVKFEMSLTIGSTTTFGNSASAWSFSLPVSGTQNSPQDFIAGQCFDISTTTDFIVNGQIGSGLNTLTLSRNGSGVRDSFPFAWAAGDTIKISITYMAV